MNFYNDNDESACFWISALMGAGLIPRGKVDGRSITELRAAEFIGAFLEAEKEMTGRQS